MESTILASFSPYRLDATGSVFDLAPAGTCEPSVPGTVYTLLRCNFSMFFGLAVQVLVFQRLLTPDLVPDEVFYAAFAALAGS